MALGGLEEPFSASGAPQPETEAPAGGLGLSAAAAPGAAGAAGPLDWERVGTPLGEKQRALPLGAGLVEGGGEAAFEASVAPAAEPCPQTAMEALR